MRRRVFSLLLEGREARLVRSRMRADRYELSVDDIPQSIVSMSDATYLAYAYIRHIARAIDAASAPGAPLFTVHLGAGALTLPRYVEATRPGSPQLVVEFEPALYAAVVTALPLTAGSDVRVIFGDARDAADAGAAGSAAPAPPTEVPADLPASVRTAEPADWTEAQFTVVDLWDAAVIHRRVASQEFYARVAARSSADGIVVVNLLDGHPFEYSRRQASTLRSVFGDVAVVLDSEPEDDEGPLGNVLVFASNRPLAVAGDPALWGTPVPNLVYGDDLTEWIGAARIMTDADGTDSPDPDDPLWA